MLAAPARAQFEVSSEVDHTLYLQYEPIAVVTTIRSQLGQVVSLNADNENARFYFLVRDANGHELDRLPGVEQETLLLPANGTLSVTSNLARIYPVAKSGFYSVQPVVEWQGRRYSGESRHLEVVPGREVARLIGVVPADGTRRTYIVLHVSRKQQDQIALRIDDEEQHLCYGVFPLGRAILNKPPELAVDANGYGHVLFQTAPRIFIHAVFSPFGFLDSQEEFGQEYTNIGLKSLPNGAIQATGKRDLNPGPRPVQSILGKP